MATPRDGSAGERPAAKTVPRVRLTSRLRRAGFGGLRLLTVGGLVFRLLALVAIVLRRILGGHLVGGGLVGTDLLGVPGLLAGIVGGLLPFRGGLYRGVGLAAAGGVLRLALDSPEMIVERIGLGLPAALRGQVRQDHIHRYEAGGAL